MRGIVTKFQGEVIGYLGSSPEMRYTPGGKPVISLNTGVGGGEYNGKKIPVIWVRIVLWEEYAVWANETLSKGQPIRASGRVSINEYTLDSGEKRRDLELNAEDVWEFDNGEWQKIILEKKKAKEKEEVNEPDIEGAAKAMEKVRSGKAK